MSDAVVGASVAEKNGFPLPGNMRSDEELQAHLGLGP